MPPSLRREVRELVDAALALEPAARADFVRQASRGNESLSDEALRVLGEISDAIGQTVGTGPSGPDEGSLEELAPDSDLNTIDRARADSAEPFAHSSTEILAPGEEYAGAPRFEIRLRLGAGGFGSVYEVYDRRQKRTVALKVLRRLQFVDRFKREFRALADIRHPNLIELYELFGEGSRWFFTMELVRGVNFLSYVEHQPGIRAEPACDITRLRSAAAQLAQGVRFLHERGILHRDIKPGNVLVSDDGRLRLLDFGLVREMERTSSHSVLWVGTPAYMAPEQFLGQPAEEATDWYSFGVIIFQAITGMLPRNCAPNIESAFPASTPNDLRGLCLELLRPEPRARPTGGDIVRRLGTPTLPLDHPFYDLPESDAFVGRESYLERLNELLELAAAGHSVVANVHGTSGVGKSTLLRAFRRRSSHDNPDVVILSGRCYRNETISYKALDDLVDSLAQYLRTLSDAEAEALTPHGVEHLVRIFPVLRAVDGLSRVRHKSVDIVDAMELRERAFASLSDLLSRLSEKRLVLVTIDDLHWGDLDSAAFFKRLLCADEPPSLLIAASYRSEDIGTSAFLQNWHALLTASKVDVIDLPLTPLSREESKELAIRLLTREQITTRERVEAIAAESGGSPFLIDQLARFPFVTGDDRGTAPNITRVIRERIAGMPADVLHLLEVIAIAGQPIDCRAANVAAGYDADAAAGLSNLLWKHFVRVRTGTGAEEVEPYHDRIREAIVALMPAERRKARHHDLAQALQTTAAADPALIATHYLGADEFAAAAQYSVDAGDHAARMLAFDRAAQWYALALRHGTWTRSESIRIRRHLGDSLALAGRGEQAARAYLEAAAEADAADAFELKRLAAEQSLRIGRFQEGVELLNAIARQAGVWIPSHRWLILGSLLWHRLKVASRTLHVPAASPNGVSERARIRLEAYWSLVLGFATLDVIRSVEFQARHLLLAMRSRDRERTAMALATEAAQRASAAGRADGKVAGLLAEAERTMADSTHPQAPGLIAVMKSLASLLAGDWADAEHHANRADAVLRERCTGVAWELATSILVRTSALIHQGAWGRLGDPFRRLEQINEAASQHDAHAVHALASGMSLLFLLKDRPDLTRLFDEPVIDALPASGQRAGYLLPQLWVLESRVDTALYEQQPDLAWRLIETDWPALSGSWHFRVQYVSMFAHYLRGRAALANALNQSTGRPAFMREARRSADRLRRHDLRPAHAFSLMLQAGIATVNNQPKESAVLFERAERLALETSMTFYAAACTQRRAALSGGAGLRDGSAWTADVVVNPQRLFDVFAPGCFPPSPVSES